MAGKKKAAKSAKAKKATAVAKKAAAKAPAKQRGRPAKVVELAAFKPNDVDQEIKDEFTKQKAAYDADLKAHPYAYKVVAFMERGHYMVDSFKSVEAAQQCVDANHQLNTINWQIVIEKRAFDREPHDAW